MVFELFLVALVLTTLSLNLNAFSQWGLRWHYQRRIISAQAQRGNLERIPFNRNHVVSKITRLETLSSSGNVLVAKKCEKDSFFAKACVLIFDHNNRDNKTRGVLLEKITPFFMGDTAPALSAFATNVMYLGGNHGGDMATVYHWQNFSSTGSTGTGTSKHLGGGIFSGGIRECSTMVEEYRAHPKDFKFISNHVEWPSSDLLGEVDIGRWDVVAVPPSLAIRSSTGSGSASGSGSARGDSLWQQCQLALYGSAS